MPMSFQFMSVSSSAISATAIRADLDMPAIVVVPTGLAAFALSEQARDDQKGDAQDHYVLQRQQTFKTGHVETEPVGCAVAHPRGFYEFRDISLPQLIRFPSTLYSGLR